MIPRSGALPSSLSYGDARQDPCDRFVIAAHHPDRLRRPVIRPGVHEKDRRQQALAWNLFRTLELLTPAFWMRLFHTRAFGEPLTPAPQIVRISLWRSLPLPPVQRLDGDRPEAFADVIIETEHAQWTLVCASDEERWEAVSRCETLADAGAWHAGARRHHCGIIDDGTAEPSLREVLRARYSRSRQSAALRTAVPLLPRSSGTPGVARWSDIAAILKECADADSLPPVERAIARNAVAWLDRLKM